MSGQKGCQQRTPENNQEISKRQEEGISVLSSVMQNT